LTYGKTLYPFLQRYLAPLTLNKSRVILKTSSISSATAAPAKKKAALNIG
jgi:hypothetical protein